METTLIVTAVAVCCIPALGYLGNVNSQNIYNEKTESGLTQLTSLVSPSTRPETGGDVYRAEPVRLIDKPPAPGEMDQPSGGNNGQQDVIGDTTTDNSGANTTSSDAKRDTIANNTPNDGTAIDGGGRNLDLIRKGLKSQTSSQDAAKALEYAQALNNYLDKLDALSQKPMPPAALTQKVDIITTKAVDTYNDLNKTTTDLQQQAAKTATKADDQGLQPLTQYVNITYQNTFLDPTQLVQTFLTVNPQFNSPQYAEQIKSTQTLVNQAYSKASVPLSP